DLELLFEIVQDFYPGIKEREPLLEEICKDIPKAKEADMSPEGTRKMTEARDNRQQLGQAETVVQAHTTIELVLIFLTYHNMCELRSFTQQ
ncbi:hypothetical protein TNCT_225621, partial [Trichonephila clavata]